MLVVDQLAKYWWLVALRGLAALIFGVLTLIWPGMSLGVLILIFGIYALADGVLALIAAVRGDAGHRLALALNGVVGVLAGVAAFVWPGVTALALLYIIAYWAILTGVLQVVSAIRLRRAITNEWSMIAAGVLSVLLGVVLVAAPGAGALGLVLVIGAYAVLFGAMWLVLAFRLRSHHAPVGVPRRTVAA
jgi:uncharacterized membrane protein HdeD (DUF308 family)